MVGKRERHAAEVAQGDTAPAKEEEQDGQIPATSQVAGAGVGDTGEVADTAAQEQVRNWGLPQHLPLAPMPRMLLHVTCHP